MKRKTHYTHHCRRAVAIAASIVLALVSFRCWRIYKCTLVFREDVQSLELAASRPTAGLASIGPLLKKTRADIVTLRAEFTPLLPLTQRLGWVPIYGPDLAVAGPLLDTGDNLAAAADDIFDALAPVMIRRANAQPLGPSLIDQLVAGRPKLEAAQQALTRATAAQKHVPIDELSPWLQDRLRLVEKVLPAAQDVLDLSLAAPDLLGAHGQRSYLLLTQDLNEMRATGGFIGAAGRLTFDKGWLTSLSILDSSAVDNLAAHPYPAPPEPLLRYMDIELWTFRDANWSPDFPTSARAAIDFYKLGQGYTADGVIAFDQNFIQLLLTAIGPVSVAGHPELISAKNILQYMRDQYNQQLRTDRKAFMAPLAQAIMRKLTANPPDLNIAAIWQSLDQALEERHLLIYLQDHSASAVLARHGWDGAVRPGTNDFLMVVDSNLGYNKVNPNIDEAISYSVDLSDLRAPTALLTIQYIHHLKGSISCQQNGQTRVSRYEDFFVGCYWDYLRALIPAGSQLLAATTQSVPGAWMMSGIGDEGSARLDRGEASTNVISAFLVVPIGGERQTIFQYRLPATVLSQDADGWHYHLVLQKQAGTQQIPISVTVRLPPSAQLTSTSHYSAAMNDQKILFQFNLGQDRQLDVIFRT